MLSRFEDMNPDFRKQVLDGTTRRVRGFGLRNGTYAVQATVLDAATGVKKVKSPLAAISACNLRSTL
jgi:hypothetical protein